VRLTDGQARELDRLIVHHGHGSRILEHERDVAAPLHLKHGVGFSVRFFMDFAFWVASVATMNPAQLFLRWTEESCSSKNLTSAAGSTYKVGGFNS
jgi:hypothetical protein